jgi:hypothetical protein
VTTESLHQIMARIQPRITMPPRQIALLQPPADIEVPRMLTIEDPESGKTVVTVGITETEREAAGWKAEDFLVRLRGNLVGEGINRNGAAWEKADLAFGLPSVPHGPLNWLHEDRKVIGCLTAAQLADEGATVQADSVVWGWLWPKEAAMVEDVALQQRLFYSMECIAPTIQCVGPNGCGAEMGSLDSLNKTEKACEHVRGRTSGRRFVNPIFQGAAVIVPPKSPGWANAHLGLMQESSTSLSEAAGFSGETDDTDVQLGAQILSFIRGTS